MAARKFLFSIARNKAEDSFKEDLHMLSRRIRSLYSTSTLGAYFEWDHSLNIFEYFSKGTLPAGHQAVFEFIRRQTATK
jgi:hypothetical protein